MEDISFEAPDREGSVVEITAGYVRERVSNLMRNADLRKYIL